MDSLCCAMNNMILHGQHSHYVFRCSRIKRHAYRPPILTKFFLGFRSHYRKTKKVSKNRQLQLSAAYSFHSVIIQYYIVRATQVTHFVPHILFYVMGGKCKFCKLEKEMKKQYIKILHPFERMLELALRFFPLPVIQPMFHATIGNKIGLTSFNMSPPALQHHL